MQLIYAVSAFGLALVLFGLPAAASSYDDCKASAAGIDPKLKTCDAAETKVKEALLNQAYQQLISAIPSARQAKLRAAERLWVGFRDAECDFRMSVDAGGSDAGLIESGCRLALTTERIADLQNGYTAAKF